MRAGLQMRRCMLSSRCSNQNIEYCIRFHGIKSITFLLCRVMEPHSWKKTYHSNTFLQGQRKTHKGGGHRGKTVNSGAWVDVSVLSVSRMIKVIRGWMSKRFAWGLLSNFRTQTFHAPIFFFTNRKCT